MQSQNGFMRLVGSQTALLRFGVPITGGRKVIESPRTATRLLTPQLFS
jgi:hypothetical protein